VKTDVARSAHIKCEFCRENVKRGKFRMHYDCPEVYKALSAFNRCVFIWSSHGSLCKGGGAVLCEVPDGEHTWLPQNARAGHFMLCARHEKYLHAVPLQARHGAKSGTSVFPVCDDCNKRHAEGRCEL